MLELYERKNKMQSLMKNHNNTPFFQDKIKWLNYIFITIIFLLNFLGKPEIKFVYLGYVTFLYLIVLLYDFPYIITPIIAFSFIEGQGRILWGYHPFVRLAFDGLIIIATLRNFIKNKDFNITKLLPKPMLILVLLHFLWYTVEIFNLDSVNFFAAIAGTKLYIFPFFLLIYLRQNESYFNIENLQKMANMILLLLFLESLLSFYQLQGLENFMLGISPNYHKAMRGGIFTLDKFRPFGTTHLPGGISMYIFITTGLIFLRKKMSKSFMLIAIPLIPTLVLVLITTQVRSATLKFSLILLGTLVSYLINTAKLNKALIKLTLVGVIASAGFITIYPSISRYIDQYINLEAGLQRWKGFSDIDDFASQRSSFSFAYKTISERLEKFPLGLGPGVSGAVITLSLEEIKDDPVYTLDTFWGFENFYISLAVEFGYGFIFYLFYILIIPVISTVFWYRTYKLKRYDSARVIAVSLVILVTILMGNWGAIGFTYNPESFYFWLTTAIIFNTYYREVKIKDFSLEKV